MLYSICSLLAPTDTVAATGVAGCGKTLYLKGVEVNRIVDGGRNYWYRLPIDYNKNKQYPVVLGSMAQAA